MRTASLGVELGQLGVIALVAALRLLVIRFGLQKAWAARGLVYTRWVELPRSGRSSAW